MSLFSVESQQFGMAKESVRGTAEAAPTKWFPTRGKIELNYLLKHLKDEGVRGIAAEFAPIAGPKEGDAKIPMNLDPQSCVEFFQGLLGTVTSAEETTITISASNNKINFNIGGGELTATVANATYAIGLTQADAGSLCKAIYDAIVAAEAVGTYTVSYSRTTKLFTIARSAGTFQLKFLTGTNNAASIDTTLGFTHTDKTGAITYTGATQIEYAFKHTVVRSASIQKQSYTWFADRGMNVMKYNLGCVKSLSFKAGTDDLIEMEVDGMFKSEASGSIGSPSYPTQRYLSFQHSTFKIASSQNTEIKDWSLKLDNGAIRHRVHNNSQDLKDILAPTKFSISGGFTVFFEDATERAKFLANTAVALEMLVEGDTIAGSSKWGVDVNIYNARYEAFPYGEEEGLLAAKATFKGFYSTSDSKEIQVDVKNQDVSY